MIIKVKTLVFCESFEYGDVHVMVASNRNIFTFSQTLQPINDLQNHPTIT